MVAVSVMNVGERFAEKEVLQVYYLWVLQHWKQIISMSCDI